MTDQAYSSENYHDELNSLLVEVVTKLLRGESRTVGGMDWDDAERFLRLAQKAYQAGVDPEPPYSVSIETHVLSGGSFDPLDEAYVSADIMPLFDELGGEVSVSVKPVRLSELMTYSDDPGSIGDAISAVEASLERAKAKLETLQQGV